MGTVLVVEALPGLESEIGRWLWQMQEVRRQTIASVEGLPQEVLDWEGPDGGENAVGSLLYHIGLTEMLWLFMDIFEGELPDRVKAHFPFDAAEGGRLTRVLGARLPEHLDRLQRSRAIFFDMLRDMTLKDWRTLRSPNDVEYRATPEWIVFHLVEHEAGHAAQVRSMKARALRALA